MSRRGEGAIGGSFNNEAGNHGMTAQEINRSGDPGTMDLQEPLAPRVTRLEAFWKLFRKNRLAVLGMAIFAGKHVSRDAQARIIDHQRFARQCPGRHLAKHPEAMVGSGQTVAVQDF